MKTVFINCSDRVYTVDIDGTDTCGSLKRRVSEKARGRVKGDDNYVFGSKILDNDIPIHEYGIQHGSTIFVTPRLLGGGSINLFGLEIPTDPLTLILWAILIGVTIFLCCQITNWIYMAIGWVWENVLEQPWLCLMRWIFKPIFRMLRDCTRFFVHSLIHEPCIGCDECCHPYKKKYHDFV